VRDPLVRELFAAIDRAVDRRMADSIREPVADGGVA
jgi:hypothetical protein